MDKLLPALEEKKHAIFVFLEYSACFGTHSCLMLYAFFANRSQQCASTQLNHPSDAKIKALSMAQEQALFVSICISTDFSRMCSNNIMNNGEESFLMKSVHTSFIVFSI